MGSTRGLRGAGRPVVAAGITAAALVFSCAPAASARTTIVRSFDGTPLNVHFHPAPGVTAERKAPTIMVGPGWGLPGEDRPGGGTIGPYVRAGYNVITWDPRGFWASGGTAMIDHPDYEARDAQTLIDFVAQQPEALLDAPGDPRVGMSGSSYGGGIQFVTAARDRRVDAIAPTIAWHSLPRTLLGALEIPTRAGPVKIGWGLILAGAGVATATLPGVLSPAGIQAGHVAPQFYDAITRATTTGTVSRPTLQWFAAHGPAELMSSIRAPTLIVQGLVDTLFPPEEAHRNYMSLRRRGVPLRMMWFCGGHGTCRTGTGNPSLVGNLAGEAGLVLRRKLAWFQRFLQKDRKAVTGPRFEWVDENRRWHTYRSYPPRLVGKATGSGSGRLTLLPGVNPVSGFLVGATPDPLLGLRVPISKPARGLQLVGSPALRLTYRATGVTLLPQRRTYVYAQILDRGRNIVVGGQVTPVPITMDGRLRTVQVELERIASHPTPQGYALQLTPQSNVYDAQRATGAVTVRDASVTLPLTR